MKKKSQKQSIKKFKCDCGFHQIEIDTTPLEGDEFIGFAITEHRSGYTGKLFKKPRQEGEVILIGKRALKFKKALKKWINQ